MAGTFSGPLAVGLRPAAAQQAPPSCLGIGSVDRVDDRTVEIALHANADGVSKNPLHGKLHVYTSNTNSIVLFDRDPVPSSANPRPDSFQTVPPILVRFSMDVSQIKGLILETTGAGCEVSTYLIGNRRPAMGTQLAENVQNITPIVASPQPISLECPVPFGYPHVIQAAQVFTPQIAVRGNKGGTVLVLIDLRADGTVSDAHIQKSPSDDLNGAALQAARESIYAPEYVACVAVPARYIFVVEFQTR
jgi:TonB family protein